MGEGLGVGLGAGVAVGLVVGLADGRSSEAELAEGAALGGIVPVAQPDKASKAAVAPTATDLGISTREL